MKQSEVTPQFVENIPESLSDGFLYISERYETAVHLCCCGCGEEVVTPLTPVDWQLRKERNTVTLHPSIGNGNFACKSHYVIKRNKVEWMSSMTTKLIERARRRDQLDKARYIDEVNEKKHASFANPENVIQEIPRQKLEGVQHRLWRVISKWLSI